MAPATRGQILTEELTLQATRTRWFVGVTFEMLLATLGAGQGRQTGLLGGPGGHRRAMGKKGFNFRVGTISTCSSAFSSIIPHCRYQPVLRCNSHPQNQWDARD